MAAAAAAAVKRRHEVEAAIAEGNIGIGARIESYAKKVGPKSHVAVCGGKEERILTGPSAKDPLPPADQAGIWRFQRKAGLPYGFCRRLRKPVVEFLHILAALCCRQASVFCIKPV